VIRTDSVRSRAAFSHLALCALLCAPPLVARASPVSVRVLEGTVRGRVKAPPERLRPLPGVLAARARAVAREAD